MCDLIDLDSPNVKGLLDQKLASPLIPVPRNVEPNNDEQANPLVTEKRESLNNNPFDTVLHETTEYVSKKGDPFEMMLQRALKSKGKKNANLRVQSVEFPNDFTPKRRKRYLKRLNKTLDESQIGSNMGSKNLAIKLNEENINFDANSADLGCNNNSTVCNNIENNNVVSKQSQKSFVTDVASFESSILSQSAMNDTLLEAENKYKEDEILTPLKKDTLFRDFSCPINVNHYRSSSQGDRKILTDLQYLDDKRSQSTTDVFRKASQNDSSAMLSFLERGFLESKQSEQSLFSTLSNVSSITRLNSVSITSNLSLSLLSNNTMNQAFLESHSLKNHERINRTENSMNVKPMQYNLSDLADRLNKLKCTINNTTNIPSMTEKIEEFNNVKEEDNNHLKEESNHVKKENKEITNDKLIDVEIFVPESNFNGEYNRSATSTSSSDSVFNDNSKINKSILNEAKALARTFEELVLKTDSASSMDDLISNNTLWMSELLPAFEDEDVVDNLIELPISPKTDVKDAKNNDMKQSSMNVDNTEDNSLKERGLQFTDCVSAIRQTTVSTLLLDLKKLVKAENNLEASQLLDNLENVLGIKCKSNTELLATCLNISNELRTPEISDDKTDITEQSSKISTDKSREENKNVSSEEKIYNSEKTLPHINKKLENTSPVTTISSNNSSAKILSYKDDSKNSSNISSSPKKTITDYSKEKDNHVDEKLAIELLVNLRKLLSGQAEDSTKLQLLKNIGKTLNIASDKFKDELQVDSEMQNNQQITQNKITESKCEQFSSISNKVAHERSFVSKCKTNRRSTSVIDSSTKDTPQIRKPKNTSGLENLKKRFSSDPGSINTITRKKIVNSEVCGVRKEVSDLDSKKEKPLAIIDVKNKLKKKSNMINKRGPIKAVHPVGNMQKRASLGKQTESSSQITTPPKSDKAISSGSKIISSTPNSRDNNYMIKSVKSKPVASSTPDGQHSRASRAQLTSTNSSKKCTFSCDISPVNTYASNKVNDDQKVSPKRSNKLSTPKKCTPNRQMNSSGIPKYSTPPRRLNSSLDMNRHQSLLESPQHFHNKSLTGYQRYSPVCSKKSAEKISQSPLKDSNKIAIKVKPLKLISRLKRHSISCDAEKENYA